MRRVLAVCVSLALAVAGSLVAIEPATAATTDFVSSWDTRNVSAHGGDGSVDSSPEDSIQLPLVSDGSYDFVVDWGDSSTSSVTAWDDPDALHQYATPGVYTITISGTIDGFAFRQNGDRNKLLDVSQWGSLALGNTGGYFDYAENFNSSATDAPNLYRTTNFNRAFAGASHFNGTLNNWDVSTVTEMGSVFEGASAFNQPLDQWDVSNVQVMRAMFYGAGSFNQDISGWDVSKVWHFGIMFVSASSFNQDLSGWDIASGGIAASTISELRSMLSGAAISVANYSRMLVAWAALPNIANMYINEEGNHAPRGFGINASYSSDPAVVAARDYLVSLGWNISDNGIVVAPTTVGSSETVTVSYHNNTADAQTIDGLTVGGDTAPDYVVDTNASACMNATVDADASCDITLTFAPIFSGHRLAAVHVHIAGEPAGAFREVTLDYKGYDPFCETAFTQGSGTVNDPYLVGTLAQLNCISAVDMWGDYLYMTSSFKLTADIDAGGADDSFNPIGDWWISYHGTFDGDGHTISNLVSEGSFPSLVGWMVGATVKNLTFDAPQLTADYYGALVTTWADSNSQILNVHVNGGSITGLYNGGYYAGLASFADHTVVEDSSSTADITISATDYVYAGGLVAQVDTGSAINRSFSGGSITLTDTGAPSDVRVGGLAGILQSATIRNSYSTTTITSSMTGEAPTFGGLVGWSNGAVIDRTYASGAIAVGQTATAHGLVGTVATDRGATTVAQSVWDIESTGVAFDPLEGELAAEPATAAEMVDPAFFTGHQWLLNPSYDSDQDWYQPADSYPVLTWQGPSASSPATVGATSMQAPAEHTLTFNSGGGSSASPVTFANRDAVALPTVTRAGYVFQGWFLSADATTAVADPYSPALTSDMTLYAQWAVQYTASFDTQGGSSVSDVYFAEGDSIELPAAPTRSGYRFAGWFEAADSGSALESPYVPQSAADLTLYAQWTPEYTVTYNTGGGSSVADGSFIDGESITLPADPTRSGYEFLGWFESADGGSALESPYTPGVTNDITLYAHWAAVYTVSYNTGGGSSVASSTFTAGESVSLPSAPTRSGYRFLGWFSDAVLGVELSDPYTPGVTHDVTVYAHWQQLFTVTYNTGGGSTVAQGTFGEGESITLPAAPTRSGYTFAGWFAAATGGEALDEAYTPGVAEDITIYARWTANSSPAQNRTPVIDLSLGIPTGSVLAGSSTTISASGLQDTAPFTVVVRSTPQTLASGNAVGGSVTTQVTMPSGLEAGWHSLTFSSIAADGSTVTSVLYFKLSDDGTLLATSDTLPAELASTGANALSSGVYAGALVLVGALLVVARRVRRRPQSAR